MELSFKNTSPENSQERRNDEVLLCIKEFVASEGFVDHLGIPVEIKKAVWPTVEDRVAAERLKKALADHPEHPWGMVVEKCIDYLESPAIFDTLRAHEDHHLRRAIEKDMKKRASLEKEKSPESETAKIFDEARNALGHNRLSRNYYTGFLSIMQDPHVEYSPESQRFFEKESEIFPLTETSVSEQVDFLYDKLSDEEKERLVREHAKFAVSLADDFLRAG